MTQYKVIMEKFFKRVPKPVEQENAPSAPPQLLPQKRKATTFQTAWQANPVTKKRRLWLSHSDDRLFCSFCKDHAVQLNIPRKSPWISDGSKQFNSSKNLFSLVFDFTVSQRASTGMRIVIITKQL